MSRFFRPPSGDLYVSKKYKLEGKRMDVIIIRFGPKILVRIVEVERGLVISKISKSLR